MSYMGKAKKQDLTVLADELGLVVEEDMKVIDIKNLILGHDKYEEEFTKAQLEVIVEERKKKEEWDFLERKRELDERQKKQDWEMRLREKELELEKIKLETDQAVLTNPNRAEGKTHGVKLAELMPKFNPKENDIALFLTLFERQIKRIGTDKKHWVSVILSLMPSDITETIARETEENFDNYDYIKSILLKKFKLSPEIFRQKFVKHQRDPAKTWRDFVFEITNYFEEWIDGLEVRDFEELKNLVITDQLKKRVPMEIREHFLDEWANLKVPSDLADKLDTYESVRVVNKKNMSGSNLRKPFSPPRVESDKSKSYPTNQFSNKQHFYRSENSKQSFKPTCYTCGLVGHVSKFCSQNNIKKQPANSTSNNNVKSAGTFSQKNPALVARVTAPVTKEVDVRSDINKLQVVKIKCGDSILSGILDSGAQVTVIREDLVLGIPFEGDGQIKIESAFGESEITPLRIFELKIEDEIHGKVPIACAVSKKLVNDLLLSTKAYKALSENIQIHSSKKIYELTCQEENLEDRSQTQDLTNKTGSEVVEKEHRSVSMDLNSGQHQVSENKEKELLGTLQREDETLKKCFEWAVKSENCYEIIEGLLFHSENICGEKVKQIVLPLQKRQKVLELAHEIPLAGHLGEKKTTQRIKYSFYWPSIKHDVKAYCDSCTPCQLRRVVTYQDRIPIQPLIRPETPFQVWSVDCIGPLEPPSRRGHRFIICAVDLCTRWAEAIPVKEISAKTTCSSLMKIFVQTGFPETICTDQGTNFTAKLTKAFLETVGVSPRFSTPGHPESMGAVERFNRTLKNMLNKNIQEHGRNWDIHLPYLLFAYRETPHSTTGMPPFQLVYGRLPPGPLTLLKDFWTGKRNIPTDVSPSVESYLADLMEKMRSAHELAGANSRSSQESYAARYNLRSKPKSYNVGDKVLILIPSSSHKLLNTWTGPATVIQLTRPHSAKVELEDGSIRELHVNKLRPFIARVQHVGLVFEQDEDFGDLHYAPAEALHQTTKDIHEFIHGIRGNLSVKRREELFKVMQWHAEVFSGKPGHAKVEEHSVRVTQECSPKKLKPYRVPISLQEEVDRQIKELLDLNLIEPSNSDWAHPVVCVAKRNGSVRLCIDFRLLNSFTIPDAYPMKIARDLLYEIGTAHFISVLDLTKGYWQIPMKKEHRHYTAFITHSGHYQWKVLPFGMKNAGSTFQRSMDKALAPHRKYCRAYIDDLAIFSKTWNEHLHHLEEVLKTIKSSGLTVNLEKCEFGKNKVKYLGHVIGSGQHSPDPEKLEVIRQLKQPETKKELRSLLGLASYYRDYIKDFSRIALPLTNLTKKNIPQNIPWNSLAEEAFMKIKEELINIPLLYTPILEKPFQLYTDASATAIGACLAQNDDQGKEKPIAFFSKKLTDCQQKWSTIEREAFCVLEALKKFDTWIFGANIEVISDHNPLAYLTQSVPHGAKLTRWSLALQRYNLTISYRRGSKHGNADALSRLPIS